MTRASTAATPARDLTFEEYLALPETKRRQEVIDGVLIVSPAPTIGHQISILRFCRPLQDFAIPRNLGLIVPAPADILIRKIPKLRTRQPDVMFIGTAKLAGLDLDRVNVLEVAPDLAIEIASPSERPGAWAEKLADYASIGVPEVWHATPKSPSVEVLGLNAGRYERLGLYGRDEAVRSVVLPGLVLPVAPLFAD